MKIVGICGSPRKGTSEFMLKTVLDSAIENGADVDIILLSNINIEFIGTGKSDDFSFVAKKIIEAGVLIFASPCYYDMISPQLLNLIDRLDVYAESMKNKKVAILISGKEDYETSGKNAVEYLQRACKIYRMKFAGSVFGKAEKPGEIAANLQVISQLKKLGEKIARN